MSSQQLHSYQFATTDNKIRTLRLKLALIQCPNYRKTKKKTLLMLPINDSNLLNFPIIRMKKCKESSLNHLESKLEFIFVVFGEFNLSDLSALIHITNYKAFLLILGTIASQFSFLVRTGDDKNIGNSSLDSFKPTKINSNKSHIFVVVAVKIASLSLS